MLESDFFFVTQGHKFLKLLCIIDSRHLKSGTVEANARPESSVGSLCEACSLPAPEPSQFRGAKRKYQFGNATGITEVVGIF